MAKGLLDTLNTNVVKSLLPLDPLKGTPLMDSGIIVPDSRLLPLASGISRTFEVPYIHPLDADLEPNYGNTILTDIAENNPMFSEEFFGPVAMFFRVPDEDAAVALANNSPFGLGGSVFTKDVERGRSVARRIETGMVFVNSAAVSLPDLPFGGVKNSGYGRELSALGIQEFVNKKLIRVA